MNEKSWLRVVNSCFDNLKVILNPSVVSTLSRADGLWIDSAEGSKTFTVPFDSAQDKLRRSIKNLKRVWIVAIGVAIALGGAVAQAQQTQKTWKIGVLVSGTASSDASRDEALLRLIKKYLD